MINRRSLIVISLVIACQDSLAQVMYRMQPLGIVNGCPPNVMAFNNADQATGDICSSQVGNSHAFLWKHDGTPPLDLGPYQAGFNSVGLAINASGVVTGYAYGGNGEFFSFISSGDGLPLTKIKNGLGGTQVASLAINDSGQLTGNATTTGDSVSHAFLWTNNVAPMRDVGTLGGAFSTGTAINAGGQITGYADLKGGAASHAFLWRNDGTRMLDLGTLGGTSSQGLFINSTGQVAGNSNVPGDEYDHAFLSENDGTAMHDLGTLGGPSSIAVALNDAGQVAGISATGTGNTRRAFVWLNNGKPMKDLGALGGTSSKASDLNASGQVTGVASLSGGSDHAFLWRNDGTTMQDLNKLIDPRDPLKRYVTLTRGFFISDSGDIMAEGRDARTNASGAYLVYGTVLRLTPRSLAFGNQPINTSSSASSVTVTNTGSKAVPFTGTSMTGSSIGQYVAADNCGASLASHATCTIQVTFRPTTKGPKYGFLKVNGGAGGLLLVHLTGTGN